MTFKDRNDLIKGLIKDLIKIHEKYTSTTHILTDTEWEEYIDIMTKRSQELKGTTLATFADYAKQAFLNDTEYVQKELKAL